MIRLIGGIISIPLLCSIFVWAGQYLFPVIKFGTSSHNRQLPNGFTLMIPYNDVAPLLLFLTPNKFAIAFWAAAILITLFIATPGICLLLKLKLTRFQAMTAFGTIVGLAIPIVLFIIFPLIKQGQAPMLSSYLILIQLMLFGAYLGFSISGVFWFISIKDNGYVKS